jgi:hypothetical protein
MRHEQSVVRSCRNHEAAVVNLTGFQLTVLVFVFLIPIICEYCVIVETASYFSRKVWSASEDLNHSNIGMRGLNPVLGMDVHPRFSVLSCIRGSLAMGGSCNLMSPTEYLMV